MYTARIVFYVGMFYTFCSMGHLKELRMLDLSENEFKILPKVTYQLEELETLNLAVNQKLERIDDVASNENIKVL